VKEFLVTSNDERIRVPQHFRKAQKKLARLQRTVARKQKGSNRRKKAVNRVAKLHLKIARQRKDFHFKVWSWLLEKYDVIIHEKLNIKELAKTRLAKSVLDAGWGQFLEIGESKAERAGKLTVSENPNGTSIDCSGCGEKVAKTLADRVHECPACGLFLCRDLNAAINIKKRAVGHQARELTGNVLAVVESHRRSPHCTA
jgi:putative transposase